MPTELKGLDRENYRRAVEALSSGRLYQQWQREQDRAAMKRALRAIQDSRHDR